MLKTVRFMESSSAYQEAGVDPFAGCLLNETQTKQMKWKQESLLASESVWMNFKVGLKKTTKHAKGVKECFVIDF